MIPTPEEVLADPNASPWLKVSLRSAMDRDPVQSATDAMILAKVLGRWVSNPYRLTLTDQRTEVA